MRRVRWRLRLGGWVRWRGSEGVRYVGEESRAVALVLSCCCPSAWLVQLLAVPLLVLLPRCPGCPCAWLPWLRLCLASVFRGAGVDAGDPCDARQCAEGVAELP